MDAVDRKIINFLQKNGRIAHAKIGNEINLSTSAVNDRVKRLQDTEVIKNTVVTINPSKIDLNTLLSRCESAWASLFKSTPFAFSRVYKAAPSGFNIGST